MQMYQLHQLLCSFARRLFCLFGFSRTLRFPLLFMFFFFGGQTGVFCFQYLSYPFY